MSVNDFPYYNARSGRLMYDHLGICINCGHEARLHNRGCNLRGRWDPQTRTYSGCGCNEDSPAQDVEGSIAAALWRAWTR